MSLSLENFNKYSSTTSINPVMSAQNNNFNVMNGGGIFEIFDIFGTAEASLPFLYLLLTNCCLLSYMCSNQGGVFGKSDEAYFIYFWIIVTIIGSSLFMFVMTSPIPVMPPVNLVAYGIVLVTLVVSSFLMCFD